MQTYAGPGGTPQEILPLEMYLSNIWGWDAEQVERIMDLLGEQEAARPGALPAPADAEDDEDNGLTEERE